MRNRPIFNNSLPNLRKWPEEIRRAPVPIIRFPGKLFGNWTTDTTPTHLYIYFALIVLRLRDSQGMYCN